MIQRINKTEEILEQLRKEGKVRDIEWSTEQWQEWNNQMEEIHRDSMYKLRMSEISAANYWVD